MIRKVVQQVVKTKFLSFEEEDKIQKFYQNCQLDHVDALIHLQRALNSGYVQRESRITHSSYSNIFLMNY